MTIDTEIQPTPKAQPRPFRKTLLIALFWLVAGVALMGWGLSRWQGARDYLFGAPAPVPAPAIDYAPTAGVGPAASATTATADDTAHRLSELETRMTDLNRSATAAGNSGRAEGLLLAFAARRALDKGMALGYVEGQLASHFGATQPRAVAMIIASARQPATLDQLQTSLDAITPALVGGGSQEGWWESIKRGAANLIVVRQSGAPSPAAGDRVSRARLMIESGRVDQALAEISRLPNHEKAANWMAMARRHIEADRALDLLEAAAIMVPPASAATASPDAAPPEAAPEPDSAGNSASF